MARTCFNGATLGRARNQVESKLSISKSKAARLRAPPSRCHQSGQFVETAPRKRIKIRGYFLASGLYLIAVARLLGQRYGPASDRIRFARLMGVSFARGGALTHDN